jgi:ParB family chromosome partitioning protein
MNERTNEPAPATATEIPAQPQAKKIITGFNPETPPMAERVTMMPEFIRRDSSAALVRVEDIQRDESQPRKVFEGLEELANSIKMHGLINAILVRKHPEIAGKYIVVAGERRWQAHRLAGLDMIKVRILERDLADRERRSLQFAENNDRSALNMIEEGLFFAEEKEARGGCSNRELAKSLGLDKSYVDLRIRLLNLPKEVQEQIQNGKIDSPSAAYRLTKIENEEELKTAVQGLVEGSITPTALRGKSQTENKAAAQVPDKKIPAADKCKKRTIDGVTISVSSAKRVTYQQWKDAIEKFIAEEIDADGRTKKVG